MIDSIGALIAAAKEKGRSRVAVAAAQDEAALEAVMAAREGGLAEPILIGDEASIRSLAGKLGLDLAGIRVVHESDPAQAAARAIALIRSGEADVLMKGMIDTSVLLKAALDKVSGIGSGRLMSHVAVMEVPNHGKLLVVTDAAINIAPDLAAKIDIVANAVKVARALGVERPKVAILAAVEKVNAEKMPCTADAAILTVMARRGQIRDCAVDGPLALDVAVSAECARVKKLESEVAGDADVLVAPDIEAGNILYKSLVDLGGAKAAGVVMGAAVPVVLTSRADSAETKLASLALAALAGLAGERE
ncbi:MAG: bifunctional enoyl-CoA hydratase/phosphate acetyltransferase [Spirochaetaceae bacterium]|nr:bifunctional enoyl-CoA hydratase/phosphate acetyltransferase [Spirochaetaceae bacterium]